MYIVTPKALLDLGVDALNDYWENWEDETNDELSRGATWPAQEVVVREVVRALIDAGHIDITETVDGKDEVVHTSHMTTSNLTYVVSVRDGDGVKDILAVRTDEQAAIDIAVIYNTDRYDRWAEVTEYDTTSIRPGNAVALPTR